MPYTASPEQKREEARVEALAARTYAQQAIDYARLLAQKWGLTDLDLTVHLWGRHS